MTVEDVAAIPEDWRTVRLDLIRFAFLPPEERALAAPDLFNKALAYASREVTIGILMHRAIVDCLWSEEWIGVGSPSGAALISVVAKALQTRNPALALHWWIQLARLALVEAPEQAALRCTTIASYARRSGLRGFAEELSEIAREPEDARLKALAERVLRSALGD